MCVFFSLGSYQQGAAALERAEKSKGGPRYNPVFRIQYVHQVDISPQVSQIKIRSSFLFFSNKYILYFNNCSLNLYVRIPIHFVGALLLMDVVILIQTLNIFIFRCMM